MDKSNLEQVSSIIKKLAIDYFEEIRDIRRHIHSYPELSFEELETSIFVQKKLKEYGIPFESNVGGYGIIARIEGVNPEYKVIALRADMDALPIQEENDVDYASKISSKMHACGHDVHTACLLGALKILTQLKDRFQGTVVGIFQPGEEKIPGGASLMLATGKIQETKSHAIIGQHVHTPLKAGTVGFRSGMYMASADELYFTVKGKGGHGAMPQDCIDPILIASHLIINLQNIVSRYGSPEIPSVLTIGKINSKGGATNIIPDEVHLEGTLRTMDETWRSKMHELITTISQGTAQTFGGQIECKILIGYPCLVNEPILTTQCNGYAIEYLGSENVYELPIRMTAEDFAFYSQVMDSTFYRLGTGNPDKGIKSSIHTSTFDIDEDALKTGAGLMAYMAIRQLLPQ